MLFEINKEASSNWHKSWSYSSSLSQMSSAFLFFTFVVMTVKMYMHHSLEVNKFELFGLWLYVSLSISMESLHWHFSAICTRGNDKISQTIDFCMRSRRLEIFWLSLAYSHSLKILAESYAPSLYSSSSLSWIYGMRYIKTNSETLYFPIHIQKREQW